jgi:membrane protease YdiL (CAAX protease family)
VISGAVILASLCWAITFGWPGGNFWVKIGLSVGVVSLYSLFWQRPNISFRPRSFFLGLFSAVILYSIFLLGNELAPYILSGVKSQVGGIYSLGAGTNKILIFLLLFLVTGPGEEIFWRGFLQNRLMERYGIFPGYLMSTALYSGVHVFSWNLMLILAAFVAGAFWGFLYLWKKDLGVQITSHSFWSAAIFAVAPVQ